jgi:hypothetical protein
VFQAEMSAFINQTQAASTTLMPPEPTSEVISNAAAIKVGSELTVFSSNDISLAKEFSADKIQVSSQTAVINMGK